MPFKRLTPLKFGILSDTYGRLNFSNNGVISSSLEIIQHSPPFLQEDDESQLF